MYSKTVIIILLGLMIFLQGCNTLKGAKDGLKEDWKTIAGVDGWIQETFW